MKRIILYILFITMVGNLAAQRINDRRPGGIGDDLGTNMSEEARLRNKADSTNTEVENVPVELHQWTIDERFGNTTDIPVDTIMHHFQNSQLTDGLNGEYNHLGNLGSPRLSRIFFNRPEESQRFFTDPYSFFYTNINQLKFTDTKSPYTNLTYYSAGDKLTGEDYLKAYFSVNANKRIGAGFLFDYLYGRGLYNSQSTAFFGAGFFGYYRGDRYQLHVIAMKNHLKAAENGGITDDRYITDPLAMAEGERTYDPENIPTVMERAWNRNDNLNIFLTHRYNLGFYRENPDTTATQTEQFVPVSSFIHTLNVSSNDHDYIAYKEPKGYYLHEYLPNDSIDETKYLSVKNTLALSLREGFNKWAQAGLTAFITYEYRQFKLPDSVPNGKNLWKESRKKYTENVVTLGGELAKTMGHTLHYNLLGETVLSGEDLGQFRLEGKADLNFPFLKDTASLKVHAYIKNLNPVFYYRHYHSHHYWWDNDDLSKEFRTRLKGEVEIERTRTILTAGVENIKNYTYLANTSVASGTQNGITTFANNVTPKQESDNIQVFTAQLKQNFKLGIFHLDNEVTFQKSSNNDVLPLPELSLYHNFYLQFKLARVLSMQLGADLRYFSKYHAPDYSPSMEHFYLQNPADKIEIGGYPFVNLYLNAHLKRTRFYVMMYHVNQGTGDNNYFLAPHYPINPRTFKLGLSWNFFD